MKRWVVSYMALDPNILLQNRPLNVGESLQTPLMLANAYQQLQTNQQALEQSKQQAPLAQLLLQERVNQLTQGNQAAQLANYQKADQLRRGSFLAASQELLPELEKGNISKVKNSITNRIKKLNEAGIDSSDSQELLDWLDENKFDQARTAMKTFIEQNMGDVKPIKLKEDERLVTPGGRVILGAEKTPDASKEVTQQMQLRRDYTKAAAPFREANQSFGRIKAVFNANDPKTINEFKKRAKLNSPRLAGNVQAFGDLALIFNFMKMLDPGSTVREGEFANAQNTGGVDDRFRNLYNQILNGSRLNDSQRQGIYLQAQGQFESVKEQHKNVVRQELDFASKNAVTPKYIPESDLELLKQQPAQQERTPNFQPPAAIQNRSYLKYAR